MRWEDKKQRIKYLSGRMKNERGPKPRPPDEKRPGNEWRKQRRRKRRSLIHFLRIEAEVLGLLM